MEKNFSRRHALAGAAAIAAAALPTIAQAIVPNDDGALFDLITRWKEGKRLEQLAGNELSLQERIAEANMPTLPAALLQPLPLPTGSIEPNNKNIGWQQHELESFAREFKSYKVTKDDLAGGVKIFVADIPMKRDVRNLAAELLPLCKQHADAQELARKGADEAQERFDEVVSANTDLIQNMADTPANTLQGLLAKCHVCQTENLFTHFMDFTDMAQSIVEDIERLAPQFIGTV